MENNNTRRITRTLLGCTLLSWLALTASTGFAGAGASGANGLVILLNVSTDGRTLNIQQVAPGVAMIPPVMQMPVTQLPVMLPPAPPKGPVEPPKADKPVKVGGIVDVFTTLNVRTGPSTNHEIIGSLHPGDPVKIVGKSDNGWFKILWKGREAWICGDYVWRPGKGAPRNGDIRGSIRKEFGDQALPPEPRNDGPSHVSSAGTPGGRQSDGGLDIPLYNQNAIGARVPSGFCGPTSLKMALEYWGIKKDINYLADADVGGATPVYTSGQGAGHQAMLDMLKKCGLGGSYMTHAKSIDWLREQTAAGHPVIVSVRGNFGGGYTTSGHILVVSGVTSDGRVILNDSAGGKRRIVSGSMFLNAWGSSNRMAIVTAK